MSAYFDQGKFKKKLKKKIAKKVEEAGRVQIKVNNGGGFYFLGFVGSAIYFISTATDFWVGVLGVLKAIVWPAFLIFEAFTKLNG